MQLGLRKPFPYGYKRKSQRPKRSVITRIAQRRSALAIDRSLNKLFKS